jgi:hypothetical protein
MSRSTFILIICIYGILQGTAMLLIPTFVSKNFGGDPTNNFELALWGFFGIINVTNSIIALYLRKSTDNEIVKVWLIGIGIAYFALFGFSIFNHFVRGLPFNDSSPIDYTLWILFGAGAIYYWGKSEKN